MIQLKFGQIPRLPGYLDQGGGRGGGSKDFYNQKQNEKKDEDSLIWVLFQKISFVTLFDTLSDTCT